MEMIELAQTSGATTITPNTALVAFSAAKIRYARVQRPAISLDQQRSIGKVLTDISSATKTTMNPTSFFPLQGYSAEHGGQAVTATYRTRQTGALAVTTQVLVLLTSPNGKYALNEPEVLDVSDYDQDGIYVASDRFSTTYGAGNTIPEAIRNYSLNLFDDYEDLVRDEDSLGVALKQELAALRQRIVSR